MWPFCSQKADWRGAEKLAAAYLRRRGYRILHRNLRLDRFELDIVAQTGDTIVFVEVRSRESDDLAAPEESIRFNKRQHLRQAARRYIARYGQPDLYYRFDVIGVVLTANERPKITHIENAFVMEE